MRIALVTPTVKTVILKRTDNLIIIDQNSKTKLSKSNFYSYTKLSIFNLINKKIGAIPKK